MTNFRRSVAVVAFALLAAVGVAAGDEGWGPLQFLMGDWEAVAKPGEPTGGFTFAADVQGHVLVRRNHADYPAKDGRGPTTHDDLMVIFREGQPPALRAIYFDSEGHVIRYAMQAGSAGQVTFVSEIIQGAPRFRLSYTRLPDGNLGGKFEVAPPGKPEEFGKYLDWVARKRP